MNNLNKIIQFNFQNSFYPRFNHYFINCSTNTKRKYFINRIL
nr:hypothetical protein Ycf47 [Ostreobium quekettii]UXE30723.1 hypothetical protein Ycf47 [Ostreobium quekettii]UXE30799.1 hypothetical protein Ycf47 [Ostreobium quekettii]UXE30875.1 hypothetical protein Ycf47 [Ostreobium quekettii]